MCPGLVDWGGVLVVACHYFGEKYTKIINNFFVVEGSICLLLKASILRAVGSLTLALFE